MPSGKRNFNHIKDKKIMIYHDAEERTDKAGFNIRDYTPVTNGKIWAHYRSTGGSEYFSAYMEGYIANAVFTINWREDIRPHMIVVFRKCIYKITHVDDLEGYKGDIKITCEMMSQAQGNFPGVIFD